LQEAEQKSESVANELHLKYEALMERRLNEMQQLATENQDDALRAEKARSREQLVRGSCGCMSALCSGVRGLLLVEL